MEALTDAEHPARWYTTNLVGVPAPVLASTAFNAHPQPLRIAGAREAAPGLFALLARCDTQAEARAVFAHHMHLGFGLGKPARRGEGEGGAGPAPGQAEARRWKTSYLKLLQGWGLDSNGQAAAVLKGWVESRFGLVPRFHQGLLARYPSPTWLRYLEHKTHPRWHNNAIWQQLDLLYTFCQWTIERFAPLGRAPWVPVWRGSCQAEEQVVQGSLRARHCTVRLNNIASFSLQREQADCFGDWVFALQLPQCKILYLPGLLESAVLGGEDEVLALGGDYAVDARYAH